MRLMQNRENTNGFLKGKALFIMQAFTLSLTEIQTNNIKQLLNSVLVGYKKLLRPRFVLSASDNTDL